jgi:glutamine amidotransferase PdxT
MALVAEKWGLIPELQGFAKAGKPVWGTCAGMIFLAERAEGERLASSNKHELSRNRAVAGRHGCLLQISVSIGAAVALGFVFASQQGRQAGVGHLRWHDLPG